MPGRPSEIYDSYLVAIGHIKWFFVFVLSVGLPICGALQQDVLRFKICVSVPYLMQIPDRS